MNIDERIDRLEHVVGAHIEQARRDYDENRRLWREQQQEIAERDRRWHQEMAEMRRDWNDQMREMREEFKGRDRNLDERIGTLVSSIGELIREMRESRSR